MAPKSWTICWTHGVLPRTSDENMQMLVAYRSLFVGGWCCFWWWLACKLWRPARGTVKVGQYHPQTTLPHLYCPKSWLWQSTVQKNALIHFRVTNFSVLSTHYFWWGISVKSLYLTQILQGCRRHRSYRAAIVGRLALGAAIGFSCRGDRWAMKFAETQTV